MIRIIRDTIWTVVHIDAVRGKIMGINHPSLLEWYLFLFILIKLVVILHPLDPKLLRLRLRPEPAGHHAVVRRSGCQPAAAGHRQDLPERERLRCVGEVQPHLQHLDPLPCLPLHRHAHHGMRPALRHHRHTQVRAAAAGRGEGRSLARRSLMIDGLCCRSVAEQERPFALGMQFVLLRTLGEYWHSWACCFQEFLGKLKKKYFFFGGGIKNEVRAIGLISYFLPFIHSWVISMVTNLNEKTLITLTSFQ